MMENRKLVLQDNQGRVLRVFAWQGEEAHVIRRGDNRRLELHTDIEELKEQGIEFVELGKINNSTLSQPFFIGELGRLDFVSDISETLKDLPEDQDGSKDWWSSLLSFLVLGLVFAAFVAFYPRTQELVKEQAEEQQVVQIVERKPPPVHRSVQAVIPTRASTNIKAPNVKRMGALAVLGSLKTGSQMGGVNIGAVNTSAGPGLGGTQGSGGVQTSLYGKGLLAAPVGPGGNIRGAGGYGTKGKGGGQEGYGTLSLVGSTGNALVPLGGDAVIEGGLDRDMIAAVIQRNMGQIRFCYEQGLQSNPALNGRVAVNFVIGANGMVKTSSIGNSTLNSAMVEQCILMRLNSWKFPLPQGGQEVSVSYPFLLKRVGG